MAVEAETLNASTFVTPLWLREQGADARILIIDCRFVLAQPEAGFESYQSGHIPGAKYAHLERDLSGPAGLHGGRHPLPDREHFFAFLERVGVRNETLVIAYDEHGDMAPRLWWLMNYFGHERVAVLRGGIAAWRAAGYPLATGSTQTAYEGGERAAGAGSPGGRRSPRSDLVIDYAGIRSMIGGALSGSHLVDARALPRYRGEYEPIDPVPGHIPTAVCFSWEDTAALISGEDSEARLRERFAPLLDGGEIVVYCGSGVTACTNLLALHSLGVTAKLYAGSYSDWCSYPDNPIAKGDDAAGGRES